MVYLLPFFYPDKGKEHQVVDKCIIKKQKNKGLGQKKDKNIYPFSILSFFYLFGKEIFLIFASHKTFQPETAVIVRHTINKPT